MSLNLGDFSMSFQDVKQILRKQVFDKDDDGQEMADYNQLMFKNSLRLYEYIFEEKKQQQKDFDGKLPSTIITAIWIFFNMGTQTRNLFDTLKYNKIMEILNSKNILEDLDMFQQIQDIKPVSLCEISNILHCGFLQNLELKVNLANLLHFRQTIFNSENCLDWYKNNNNSVIVKPVTQPNDENIKNIKHLHNLLNNFADPKYDPIFSK
uniref:Uncharacterized protein n=1 Tax=viral metagenome TaxID=1070528 RepID=A0A6C0J7Y8_9ZZZZ